VPTVVVVAFANRRMQLVWPAVFVAAVLAVTGLKGLVATIWWTQMLAPTFTTFLVAN